MAVYNPYASGSSTPKTQKKKKKNVYDPYASGTSNPGITNLFNAVGVEDPDNPYASGTSDPYTPPPDPNKQYADQFSKNSVQTTTPDPNQQYTDQFSKNTVQTASPEVNNTASATGSIVVNPYANGTSDPYTPPPVTNEVVNPYASGTSNPYTPPPDPNKQYTDAFSKSSVQTTTPVTNEVVNPYASGTSDPYTPPPDPNKQYTDAFSKSPVQTTTPPAEPPMTADMYDAILGGDDAISGLKKNELDVGMSADEYAKILAGDDPATSKGMTPDEYAAILAGDTEDDAGMSSEAYDKILAGITGDREDVSVDDVVAAKAATVPGGVSTPYDALGLPANLAVGTGDPITSAVVDSAANVADASLLDRAKDQQLIDPDTTLADAAEANVLERLTSDPLPDRPALDRALEKAAGRLDSSGVSVEGDLATSAEKVLRERLLGGSNPLIEQERADFIRRSEQQQDQLMERLNRLGVLRSGDTAEALGTFIGERERALGDIDARAFDMQSQAIDDALGFQGRRDELALANENLERAAMGDVAGLVGAADSRSAMAAGMSGDAVSQAAGLQGRRDALDIAELDASRQAMQDVYGREGQLSNLETDRINRQIATDASGRAERGLKSDLVSADLDRRLAQAGDDRAAQALGSDLTSAVLDRQLAARADTRSERGLDSDLLSAEQQRESARGADTRADQALASDLTSAEQGRRIAEAGVTGAYRQYGGDPTPIDTLTGRAMDLEEKMAIANNQRAQQQIESQLFGKVQTGLEEGADPITTLSGKQVASGLTTDELNRRIAEADVTGEYRQYGGDPTPVDTMRKQALDQDIAASQGAESRAERAIQDALFGEVEGDTTLTGEAAERAETGFDREMRDRDIVQALALGRDGYYSTPGRAAILDRLLNDSDLRRNIYTDDPAGVDLPGSPDPPPRTTPVAGQAGTRMDEEGNLYKLSPDGLEWIRV